MLFRSEILDGMPTREGVQVEHDRAQAILDGIAGGGPGDLVLVAGKGHEDYQEVDGRRTRFSDIEQVQAVLQGGRG